MKNHFQKYHLLYIMVASAAIIICFYLYQFHNGLSSNSQDWGSFGSYIGGCLGSLIYAATLYYIVKQLNELQKQNNEMQHENNIQIVMNQMNSTLTHLQHTSCRNYHINFLIKIISITLKKHCPNFINIIYNKKEESLRITYTNTDPYDIYTGNFLIIIASLYNHLGPDLTNKIITHDGLVDLPTLYLDNAIDLTNLAREAFSLRCNYRIIYHMLSQTVSPLEVLSAIKFKDSNQSLDFVKEATSLPTDNLCSVDYRYQLLAALNAKFNKHYTESDLIFQYIRPNVDSYEHRITSKIDQLTYVWNGTNWKTFPLDIMHQ